jgi:hypothetical protein
MIRGDLVDDWVMDQNEWINRELAGGRNAGEEYLWTTTRDQFKDAFTDGAEKQKAEQELQNIKMEKGDLDAYLAYFMNLSRKVGYGPNDEGTLDIFSQGLPENLVWNIIQFDHPTNWDKWVMSARKYHQYFVHLQSCFNSKKQETHGGFTKGQWRNTFAMKACYPDAMDIGHTQRGATAERPALTEPEKQKLHAEGHYFHCKKQGHIPRNCSDHPVRVAEASTTPATIRSKEEIAEEVWGNMLA